MASTLKLSSMSLTDTVSVSRKFEGGQDVAGEDSRSSVPPLQGAGGRTLCFSPATKRRPSKQLTISGEKRLARLVYWRITVQRKRAEATEALSIGLAVERTADAKVSAGVVTGCL